MRIAFMTSGTIKSSISYRPLSFARRLVEKGHKVYIFAPRFDKYSNFNDVKLTEIDGIKIVRPFQLAKVPFIVGLIPYIFSSIFILFKIRPDIIHIYKPNPITVPSLILKVIKNTPIVFDTDDLDTKVMEIEKSPKLLIYLVYLSELLASRYANAIICGSKYLVSIYNKKSKNKKIYYVPNGADFHYTPQPQKLINGKRKVIFIGNINRINILEPFFLAFEKLIKKNKSVKGIIIGDGKFLPYFKRLSKKFNLTNNITFLGYVQQQKLKNYVSTGDLGYCYMPDEPTTRACSSMKVFQYMQLGIIPIVSNVGDLPEYVFNGKAGYIVGNNNIKELSNTLLSAINNDTAIKSKNLFCFTHAKDKYSWDTLTNNLEKIDMEVYETRQK